MAKDLKVEYSSNNSGGNWWLTDQNWLDLEKAGWEVAWVKGEKHYHGEVRWLGALAKNATRKGLMLGEAITEWEKVTGENSSDLGCSCCGVPHEFTLYDGEKYIESYSPDYPRSGDRYDE